ncbi:hypothetical protein POM88_047775 [Heracleum sosnowskyi]|uniref:Uncharacterized protein n=1 Tax=Heracleum sosnowskyi TaxID=360622 RepID=A0AAD8GU47_9APIA|nr:hypothetical protein POM88_047775 [Heracleum sosnowskyi]
MVRYGVFFIAELENLTDLQPAGGVATPYYLKIMWLPNDKESVPGFIRLLEVSNPNVSSPFSVCAPRLTELIGCANPLFIDHETRDGDSYVSENYTSSNPIHNALKFSHESEGEYVEIHPFTLVSPKKSMYQDILLFLGGPDAREALAFADRMTSHPDVSLLVIRFLSHDGEGDDLIENKLDDGLVTWFWVKNEGNI